MFSWCPFSGEVVRLIPGVNQAGGVFGEVPTAQHLGEDDNMVQQKTDFP